MKTKTKERSTFVEVFYYGESPEVHDPMLALCVIGYDSDYEDYPYDPMVWFYFADEAEFERAKNPNNTEFDFYVVEPND
jgi:hypothetical protein